jgi:hypothetical protein
MEQPLPMSMLPLPHMMHDGGQADPDDDPYGHQDQAKADFLHQQSLLPPSEAQSMTSTNLKQEITDLSLNG